VIFVSRKGQQVFCDWLEKKKPIIMELGKEIESRKYKPI